MKMHRLPAQSLAELLITVAVISTGLFAAANLALSNLQLSNSDTDQLMAVNLAREGIELAKERRDSNWLAGNAFDDGFYNGNDRTAVPLWNGDVATIGVTFDFDPDDMLHSKTIVFRSTVPETEGFLLQDNSNGDPTVWRRLLTFTPLCINQNDDLLIQAPNAKVCAPHVGVRVESRVEWTWKGKSLSRVVYEDLFDWR